jgi:hypothetical protein
MTDVTTTVTGSAAIPAGTISIPAQTIQVSITIPAQTVKLTGQNIPVSLTMDETTLANVVKSLIASPSGTTVTTVGPAIVDTNGNVWTITSAGQVALNGVPDTTTSGVIALYYAGTPPLIYQENSSKGVWSRTGPTAAWVAATLPTAT